MLAPGRPTTSEPFAREAIYEMKTTRTGGDLSPTSPSFVAPTPAGGGGTARIAHGSGARAHAAGVGEGEEIIVRVPGVERRRSSGDGGRSLPLLRRLAQRSLLLRRPGASGEPRIQNFTGDDFFADHDIYSIALELPNSALGDGADLNLWHRTLVRAMARRRRTGGPRGAGLADAGYLVAEAEREAYLGEPAQDGGVAVARLGIGVPPAEARATA